MTELQLKIFNLVRDASPKGIKGNVMVSKVYADREDGGPLWARQSVAVMLSHLNRKLKGVHLRIRASSHGGAAGHATYRLEQIE